MKKVYVCVNMPHGTAYIGGVAAVVNSYIMNCESFEKNGYAVELFDYQSSVIRRIPITPLRTWIYGIGQYFRLRKVLCTDNENILHIHTSRSFLYFKDVWLGRRVCKYTKAKPVLTVHVGHIDTVHKFLPKPLQRLAISWINRYFAKVFFLSNKIKLQFIAAGLSEDKCETLYNFHDLGNENDMAQQSMTDGLRLLFVGMINRDKGILDLLDALKRCDDPSVKMDICGTITDESIRAEYHARAKDLGGQIIEWGYVKGEIKKALFTAADVLVLPSYHEGMPLVVLEALATGCALILTPIGAMPEILTDENTLWINPGDSEGIANAIKLLRTQPELLQRMKEKNYQLGENFSLHRHIQQLCKVYDSIT